MAGGAGGGTSAGGGNIQLHKPNSLDHQGLRGYLQLQQQPLAARDIIK
jgi:hypothetical protein